MTGHRLALVLVSEALIGVAQLLGGLLAAPPAWVAWGGHRTHVCRLISTGLVSICDGIICSPSYSRSGRRQHSPWLAHMGGS